MNMNMNTSVLLAHQTPPFRLTFAASPPMGKFMIDLAV